MVCEHLALTAWSQDVMKDVKVKGHVDHSHKETKSSLSRDEASTSGVYRVEAT